MISVAYVRDLESEVEGMRGREAEWAEEAERARMLVQSLQRENAILLDREREMMMVQVSIVTVLSYTLSTF